MYAQARPATAAGRLLAHLAILGLPVLLTGCAGPLSGPPSHAPAPPPSTRPSATVRAAPDTSVPRVGDRDDAEHVRAVYRRFWDVAQTLDRYPQAVWRSRLATVAADPVLSDVLDGLTGRVAAGYRQYGTVVSHPQVVDLGATRASVLDCQDASRTGEIDTATGLPTMTGRARTAVAATLTRDAAGQWRVTTARYLDTDC